MIKSLQSSWVVWMRAVTFVVTVLAVVVSAFVMSPEMDHRPLPAQIGTAAAADLAVVDGGAVQHAPATACHVGFGCMLMILPANDLGLTRFDSTPELTLETHRPASVAEDTPFHPPRILSRV